MGARIIEPEMVRVPEGWFGMGCESGRDDEKPLHRVWVDACGADWYDEGYSGRSPERNPPGPASGSRRASRVGSWRHHIKVTRTAARSSIPPEFQYADYGFRIARTKTLRTSAQY